ncbi:hypothetical protein [Halomonas salipaludis]|uniref:Uncharacterized protein n=1 Tax=Halomonas salipaludis TaxID=2032625 RepID=A0A2A2EW25_9GAMM|nr:hypothetical protein [Halomonas salipaludis]PAU76760.1 hypothetical protein CK498_12335 [Halomonas salipaludis]
MPPVKGGQLAKVAALLCQDELFRLYLDRRKRHKFGLAPGQLPDGTHSEQDARDWLCQACRIDSRAELDHNPYAAATFKGIRARFGHWRDTQRSNT